jgi:outer membrane protein assembly factor BamA
MNWLYHLKIPRQTTTLLLVLLGLLSQAALGQTEPPANSRAAEIQSARAKKAADIKPEENARLEQRLIYIKDNKVLERITGGAGGLRIKVGGMSANGGFAIGPEYLRDDLRNGAVSVRLAAQATFRLFQRFEAELNMPKLMEGRAFWNVYAVHHNYPQLQYYGPGPDSRRGNRTDFRLEDTAIDTTFGVKPITKMVKLTLAGSIGYLWNNVGPGTQKQWTNTERLFTPAQAIGINEQTDFLRYGSHAVIDYRDIPGGPRRGGFYLAQYSRYEDRKLRRHDFNKLDLELQQYIPFFNERRVIALRGRTTFTNTSAGQSVPFYMQPTLGGPDTLRGYRPFRFYGNNSLLISAEYRYEVFSGLDMAIFADAGKVTDRRAQINFRNLESSVGFGFRFNVKNNVFMRLEAAFSHEGFQIGFRFNPVFRVGPYRTSSSQGEF